MSGIDLLFGISNVRAIFAQVAVHRNGPGILAPDSHDHPLLSSPHHSGAIFHSNLHFDLTASGAWFAELLDDG